MYSALHVDETLWVPFVCVVSHPELNDWPFNITCVCSVLFALIKIMNVLIVKVREDSPGDMAYWYRHISKGAWPFSSRDHGWPISDCSSEGLKVCRSP